MRRSPVRFIAITTITVILTVIVAVLIFLVVTMLMLQHTGDTYPVAVEITTATETEPPTVATLPPIGIPAETTPVEEEYTPDVRHFVSWEFTTYTEPCFMAQVVSILPPRHVNIRYEQDGWALIYNCCSEYCEDTWVYTASDRMFIDRISGTFDEPAGRRIGRITPQVVSIVERDGRWVNISTYAGYRWLYLDFTPPVYELEYFMQQFDNISVFYENMSSGFIFRHNTERTFFGASATKLPYAIYIYLKTEAGYASMNTVSSFTEADFWEGSGIIRHRYQYGATFTQRRLLNLMLVPSDNIATRMLRRMHGLNGYREWVESIGANPDFVHNLTYSHLSADDAGIFLREAYRYITSGGRYSDDLRTNMLANRYAFIVSDHPVASKSGWAANFGAAFHDMAIVFAPSPYTLAILSNWAGTHIDMRTYREISMKIQEFNDMWFY